MNVRQSYNNLKTRVSKHAEAFKAAYMRIVGTSDGCTMAPDFDFKECCLEHDTRYRKNPEGLTRAEADKLFRTCIRQKGHLALPWIYWAAVRVFGRFAWNRYRKAQS